MKSKTLTDHLQKKLEDTTKPILFLKNNRKKANTYLAFPIGNIAQGIQIFYTFTGYRSIAANT